MVDIGELRFQRGLMKSSLTRAKKYFDSVIDDIQPIQDHIKVEINARLQRIEPLLDAFNGIQSQIEQICEVDLESQESEMHPEIVERISFENSYFSLISRMKAAISDHFERNSVNGNIFPPNIHNINSISTNAQSDRASEPSITQQIKLPTIKLPTFDGQYQNWVEFKDAFNALIHENTTLPDVQKFYYLRASLEKDALQIIEAMPVSSLNYTIAWDILKERFENSRLIVHSHIKSIFELPALHKESHTELRKLLDTVTKNIRSLKSLGQSTDSWDTLMIYIITSKFDPKTRRLWEEYDTKNQFPEMKDLNEFLKERCKILEKLDFGNVPSNTWKTNFKQEHHTFNRYDKFRNKQASTSFVTSYNNKPCCYFCKQCHTIYQCNEFLKFSPSERLTEIKKRNLCENCLKPSHVSEKCESRGCRICSKFHNTLLHNDNSKKTETKNKLSVNFAEISEPETMSSESISISNVASSIQLSSINDESVLLSTATVYVEDFSGKLQKCRALLDSGSQSNFITENLCERLRLKPRKVDCSVIGIGRSLSKIQLSATVNISSSNHNYNASIICLVLPQITGNLPRFSFHNLDIVIPDHIQLADPHFNQSGPIDMLLGSTIFWELICNGKFQIGNTRLICQNTYLGWIIAGCFSNRTLSSCAFFSCSSEDSPSDGLDKSLTKFWQLEEVNSKPIFSFADKKCEQHFQNNFIRNSEGRFVVKIPFKDNSSQLGQSRAMALRRFYSQERKRINDPILNKAYIAFMEEYEKLGHMRHICEHENDTNNFYLPHHAVVRSSSHTTKVRVVFDASMKSDSGLSLNDIQFHGPTIQNDIFSIILNFRRYRYVMTADISKMYRMILIHPDETCYQRIFWRNDTSSELRCYELQTVTYGTSSAPFLAIRSLHQLAIENEAEFPAACNVIKNNFYVDDFLGGANTKRELSILQHDVSTILESGGFQLRKWLSNDKEFCKNFYFDDKVEYSILQIGENEANKTLGVQWNANSDTIQYCVKNIESKEKITKRHILSMISQIFDPLGLLGPLIVSIKLLIQKLWQAKVGWDDAIPSELILLWNKFYNELPIVNDITVPRFIILPDYSKIDIHGFSDASERAYGACVYVVSEDLGGNRLSYLLCAKSRVAPIKQITLPRLELCGALLLAQLVQRIKDSMKIDFNNFYFWSDSTIAISWIKGEPNRSHTFVANRVSEIQRLTDVENWHHISSKDNPADLISRGMNAKDLYGCKFWFLGPEWLIDNDLINKMKNEQFQCPNDLPEQRSIIIANTVHIEHFQIFDRYSTFIKLQRVFAFILRFIFNARSSPNNRKLNTSLTPIELQNSLLKLVWLAQQESFRREYKDLREKLPINKKSKLLNLNPLMDENHIIRVGGRIQNSSHKFDKKHPIILPHNHKLTKLIMVQEHHRLLHCGPTLLLASIRERFWPISGRNLAKGIIRKCVTCFKVSPQSNDYLMGNLPSYRISKNFVFYNVGIDYAGPIIIKDRNTRGPKFTKCYICLFVCLATKAIHIECVSDMTTNCFIATLKRFIGRRGKPANIFSDNGKNFVGASSELKELYKFLEDQSKNISYFLSPQNIFWHFIPARSPNFGGIWEAGIKSAKFHLKRVIGNAHLNFEDLTTVLVQIESVLNSRPLCPLPSSPDQLNPLTPGHFLIGRSLNAIPEDNLADIPENRLKRYARLQQIFQHFWQRWRKEYLAELQARTKWKSSNPHDEIKIGSIVLIKEDNAPPLKWHMERISELHTGKDGITRVVSLQIKGGTIIKRAVTKICPLPSQEDSDHDVIQDDPAKN